MFSYGSITFHNNKINLLILLLQNLYVFVNFLITPFIDFNCFFFTFFAIIRTLVIFGPFKLILRFAVFIAVFLSYKFQTNYN